MNQIVKTISYGAFAGIFGTLIGCIIGFLILLFGKRYHRISGCNIDKNTVYALLYEFSSGLMMAIVTFHLLPEAIAVSGLTMSLMGMLFGLCFLFLLSRFLRKKQLSSATGFMMLIGIMLHNIPEGIAIGAAMVNHYSLAVSLLLVITIHDIPEGISALLSLSLQQMKLSKIIFYVILFGLPTGFAALAGSYLGAMNAQWNALTLGFASGAMLYILVFELSHEAKLFSQRKLIETAYILGLVLGILLK